MSSPDQSDDADLLREFAAAVGYLRDTGVHGLTVWEALHQAARQWIAGGLSGVHIGNMAAGWTDPDPLRTCLTDLLAAVPPVGVPGASAFGEVLASVVAAWLVTVADDVNDGHPFR